jgi:prevent-host-death family protein
MKRIVHKNGKRPTKRVNKVVEPPRRLGDKDISIADLRARLGDLVSRVSYKHDRVVITKHGKPVAALISASDMEKFQELEDWNDVQAAKASDAEARRTGGAKTLDTVLRELGLRQRSNAIHGRAESQRSA